MAGPALKSPHRSMEAVLIEWNALPVSAANADGPMTALPDCKLRPPCKQTPSPAQSASNNRVHSSSEMLSPARSLEVSIGTRKTRGCCNRLEKAVAAVQYDLWAMIELPVADLQFAGT